MSDNLEKESEVTIEVSEEYAKAMGWTIVNKVDK